MAQVSAGLGRGPGEVVDLVIHRERHQLVVGGVELHLVHAPAVAGEADELRRIAVGRLAQFEHAFGAHDRAQGRHAPVEPWAGLPHDGLPHGGIGQVEVAA